MKSSVGVVTLLVVAGVIGAFWGCGSSGREGFQATSKSPTDPGFGDGGDAHSCQGLECQQQNCNGGDTTLTGTVYAPNGTLPLYDAIVYVPNADPDAMPVGATCDPCGAVTGAPLVTTLSGSDGTFELKNMPAGDDIPLVIQIGKWRREVKIPHVAACKETKAPADLTRLPKNQSEGNMPHVALTTGGCDNLGCMLPKVGIDSSEFGTVADGPSKAIHVYSGSGGSGPAGTPQAETLWSNSATMKQYDMLVLSCECSESLDSKGGGPTSPDFAAMTEYLTAGGRIFTTDFMYTWYRYSPDPGFKTATNIRGGAPGGGAPITIDTTFPKGQALSDWLGVVGVPGGKVTADATFGNFISLDAMRAQEWASGPAPYPGPRVLTVNLPVDVPAEQQCGRAVHIDAHINSSDKVTSAYPASCATPMKPGENLLAFFFFDLASCISDDKAPPKPPAVH